MLDFATYMAAQERTAAYVSEARPEAAMRPDPAGRPFTADTVLLRQRISLVLRRLADAVEPAPVRCAPALANGR